MIVIKFYFGVSCCSNPGNGCCSFVFEKYSDGALETKHYNFATQDTTSSRLLLEGILRALELVSSFNDLDEIILFSNQKYFIDYFQKGKFNPETCVSFSKCSNSDLLIQIFQKIRLMHCPVSARMALPEKNYEMRIAKELAQQYCTEQGFVSKINFK